MKLSTFALSLAVTASSLVSISSLSQSANAATIGAQNGSFNFQGIWEFTFLYSFGGDKSTFGIGSKPSTTTTLFSETSTATPGSVTPNSPVTYTFTNSDKDFFLTSVGKSTIFSSTAHSTTPTAGFWIASSVGDYPASATTTPDIGDPAPNNPKTFASFVNTFANNGVLVIGVNDTFAGDRDYNDFIVKAKAVPVPAIVPGLALAAAFFGSKALKRNKKEASNSVA